MNNSIEKFIECLDVINGTEGVSYHAISKRTGIDEQRLKNIKTGRVKRVQEYELDRLKEAYSHFLLSPADVNDQALSVQNQIESLKKEVEQLKESVFDLREIKSTLQLILQKLN